MEPGKDSNVVGWSAGCGESYLSGAGSAGRKSTVERQHGRRPSTPSTWQMLCEYLRALNEHPDDEEIRANVIMLLEALTRWLRRGGFPPKLG